MAYEMNDEDKLYDEFGNYIGPDLGDSDGSDSDESDGDTDSQWGSIATRSPRQPGSNATPTQQRNDTNQQQQQLEDSNISNASNVSNASDDDSVSALSDSLSNLQVSTEFNNQDIIDSGALAKTNEVVLPEDMEYYQSAQTLYGDDVEAMVQEEDTQPIETPIIAPIKQKLFQFREQSLPQTTFNYKFLAGLMDMPALIRNVALIGYV